MADVLKMLRDNMAKSIKPEEKPMPGPIQYVKSNDGIDDLMNKFTEMMKEASTTRQSLENTIKDMQSQALKYMREISVLKEDIKDLTEASENRQSIDKQRIVDLQAEVEKLKARLEFASKSEPSVQVVKQNFEIPEFDVVPERGHDGKIIRAKLKPVEIKK